jgi:hypothetical protein
MVSDMFMWPVSPSGLRLLRCFRNRSLHSSIHNFLLMCDSGVVFRELRLVRGMQTEVGEELKTGKAAHGGAQQAAAELRVRLEKPPA